MFRNENYITVSYPAIFITDDYTGNIFVDIPDIGVVAGGDTIDEAFADAKEAIEEYMRHGIPPYASSVEDLGSRVREGDLVMYIDATT